MSAFFKRLRIWFGWSNRLISMGITTPEEAPLTTTLKPIYARFVFLDGCQTAKGNLPEAFGILHRENVDLNDYIAASMRPSAFAGWHAEKWIDFLNGSYINYDHVNFITAVQTEMALGNGIHDAIHNAATGWNVVFSFNWVNQMGVYGFWDLHFGQYNN